jgi:hypothetical protein
MRGNLRAYFTFIVLMSLLINLGLQPASAQEAAGETWNIAQQVSADYSLDNVMALTLQSGLGVAFRLSNEALSGLHQQSSSMTILPFENPYLVQAPYASGDPAFQQLANPSDAITLRWDTAKMDQTVTPQALAYTMISELSWHGRLNRAVAYDRQTLMQQRWLGVLWGHLAQLGACFAWTNLRDPQTGLYYHAWRAGAVADRSFEPLDQIALFWALTQLSQVSDDSAPALLSQGEAQRMARELFSALMASPDLLQNLMKMSVRGTGLWVEALAAYASSLQEPQEIAQVMQLLEAARLALATAKTWSAQAEAVTALLTVYRLTGDPQARTEALQRWDALQKLWKPQAALFVSQPNDASYLYSAQELGDAVGTFNAIIHIAGVHVQTQYAAFAAGALRTAHPQSAATSFEPFGRAPVFAASVQFEPAALQWHVVNRNFDTAGAMYLAARLNWIGTRDGEEFLMPHWGFPRSDEITLYLLRQQVGALNELASQSLPQRLDELKAALAAQSSSTKQLIASLRGDLTQLSNKLSDQQKNLDGQLKSLSDRIGALEKASAATPSPAQPTGTNNTLVVLLVVLLLVVGWTVFEWTRRRPA